MKNNKKFISIFVIIISMLACCFVFSNSHIMNVDAATTQQDCYYLMDQDGNPYSANSAVGKVEGLGQFVVGKENVTLTATANSNFQLVGWQVVYQEQNDKTIFIDCSNLEMDKKDVVLTAMDGQTEITATIEYVKKDNIFYKGTFKLTRVFENLIVRPVFDHIYYSVDITELSQISTLQSTSIGDDTLFYETQTVNGDVVEYTNAYIKIGEECFYYGNLYSKNGKFYTLHQSLTDGKTMEEVEYTAGAFRVGDTVNINLDVDIVADKLLESKNIDFVGASVIGSSVQTLTKDANENGYSIQQDQYLRTTSYILNFNVFASSNQKNVVDITYHDLYVVNLQINIDGNSEHSETSDVFGETKIDGNNILSNISIYNFYSQTTNDNLQFLIKKAQDNGSKSFRISLAENIYKTIDGENYGYYRFTALDDVANANKSYTNVNSNITIKIDYSSLMYEINFICVEYVENDGNHILNPIAGNVLDKVFKKRGENISLGLTSADEIKNLGYKFVGYAAALDAEVEEDFSCTIDFVKPQDVTIYMCYEKISYSVVFTNYNKVKIGESYPLNSVTFSVVNGQQTSAQTWTQTELVGDSVKLNSALYIGGMLSVDKVVNPGFNVLGFSTKAPQDVTADDYFTTLTFDAAFIQENNVEDTIYVYVYEELIKYTITYYTELTNDTSLNQKVIMAQLAATSTTGTIAKYDVSNTLIADGDNETIVAKIVISNLNLNDQVALSSVGFNVGTGEEAYSYVFNWFTEDGNSTLSYEKSADTYTHTEKVLRNREIKVVYSMPSTKLMIAIDEEFSSNENFTFDFEVELGGTKLAPIDGSTNVFTMDVGVTIKVTVSNVAFGYNFVGYTNIETNTSVNVDDLSFDYVTSVGINTLNLNFERIKYHFIFRQYGGGKNGDIVSFGGQNFAVMDIDNTSVEITKPIGYYVSSAKFNETHDEYSSKISENNEYRLNGDITKFNFQIDRIDFAEIIANYGVLNDQSIAEINVRLDYSIFKYRVKVQYGLTNPKNDSRDDRVSYPEIELSYVFEGVTSVAPVEYLNTEKGVAFVGIPYGANARMDLLGGATLGLSLAGWAYPNGNLVTEHQNSFEYLIVNSVVEDKAFVYRMSYNAYEIKVEYAQGQGTPEVYINNTLVTGNTKQITLYDKLEIVANASRNNGYVFDKITYSKPVYTEFVYSQEMWDLKYATLYVKKGDAYTLNTSPTYDENVKYYIYSTEQQICETDKFETDSFMVSDYALEADGQKILFVIEYKLLQLSIVNTVQEAEDLLDWGWTLQDRGNGDSKIKIDLDQMALFEVTATAKDNSERVVDENTTVNFFDTISVVVRINKQALNFDGTTYDLSLGLELNSVHVTGKLTGFEQTDLGEYKFTFYVGNYLPATSEIIDITYTLRMQAKHVKVSTIVKNSATFYANTKLTINAYEYGFASEIVDTAYIATSISHELQFLAKASIYATFKDTYKNNFVVSGIKVKYDGVLITDAEYAKYGIFVNADNSVIARLYEDLEVEFIVQPKITYNGGPVYSKTFVCDTYGNGIAQTLTVGSDTTSDIQLAEILVDAISISYISTEPNSLVVDEVVNVGRYNVLLSFKEVAEYDWLDEVFVAENVTLIIQPKELYVTYDLETLVTDSKIYDGTSDYNVEKIYKYLIFTDNKSFTVNYADIIGAVNNNLTITSANCYISSSGKDAMISSANENLFYNLYVYDITFKETKFNKNFTLKTSDLIIYNYIKIMRREIKLQNVQVYSKVFDGTDKAEIVSTENISISNTIAGDDIAINMLKLNPRFEDSAIGTNKKVLIDATSALIGADIGNYYVKALETKGLTIYPYSLSVNIRGVGKVEIINKRGLTEKDKVALIPLNATLKVSAIHPDTQEYVAIHSKISKHIKGNNEFAIGYEIAFIINGEEYAVDNNLYLSIPTIKNLTGAYFLTGQKTGKIQCAYEDGNMVIDLSQINENVNKIFMTKTKILLKAWQIVLIIVGVLLIIAVVVLILIIVRKRKVDRDSVHEKI